MPVPNLPVRKHPVFVVLSTDHDGPNFCVFATVLHFYISCTMPLSAMAGLSGEAAETSAVQTFIHFFLTMEY